MFQLDFRSPSVISLSIFLTFSLAGCSSEESDDVPPGLSGALIPGFGTAGVISSNPSPGPDVPLSIAVDDDALYVAGYDEVAGPGNRRWRIERRSLGDGSLDPAFGVAGVVSVDASAGDDEPAAISVNPFSLYIVGFDEFPGAGDRRWRIEKRRPRDGALDPNFGTAGVIAFNPSGFVDQPLALVMDLTWMYVAGFDSFPGPGDTRWRIEKRDLIDGSLDGFFGAGGVVTANPSTGDDRARAIAVDFLMVYVAGTDSSVSAVDTQWRIEKRSIADGGLDTGFGNLGVVTDNPSAGPDRPNAVAYRSGILYLGGFDSVPGLPDPGWRAESRLFADGSFATGFGAGGIISTNPSANLDQVHGVTTHSPGVYLVGSDSVPGVGDARWRIERRNLNSGILTSTFGTGGIVTVDPGPADDAAFGIAEETRFIYIVGSDSGPGNLAWRIEKRYR